MVDPVVATLFGVAVAFTKTLLRSTNNNLGAEIVGDTAGPLAEISHWVLGRKGSKKQVERAINRDLATRMRNMHERCCRKGIDPDRLANPCAEVEAVLDTIGDHKWMLEQAVHDPDTLRTNFKARALKQRAQVDERLVPYFDELITAVIEQYIAYAERSPNYLHVAAKQSLKNDKEHREADAKNLDAHAVTHDKLDTLSSKLSEVARQENEPRRVFFGSRPDAVTGDRYIERDEKKHLNALIADPTKHRTVLVGMRGCGKTQLASLVAQQCENANWALVAWINAASRESIQSDLVELANQLGIGTSDQPTQDQVIHSFLSRVKSEEPADRLIVFDNVEDINHLTGLIPSGDGVRVIATTTNKVGWEDQGWNSIEVEVFDRSESINYLLTVTNSDDRDAADALAERLGDLPLAIAQAAATARHKDLSLARYLKRLKSRGAELVIRPIHGDEYTVDAVKALLMAVKDTIEGLEGNIKETAQRQLGALALLAESGVPTRWLDPTVAQLDDDESPDTQRDTDEDAHDALTELIHRSIVQQSADGSITMLHRLQAQVLRESWNLGEHLCAYITAAELLDTVDIDRFPTNDTDSRRRETLDLIGQLRAIGEQKHSQGLLGNVAVVQSLSKVLRYASNLGIVLEALILNDTVATTQEFLSNYHPEALVARNNLAYVYMSAGRLNEATVMFEELLTDHIDIMGKDCKETLTTRNNLALTYQSAGRLDEAIALFKQLLTDSIDILGEDCKETLTTRHNLAGAYKSAGRLDEAIAMFKQLLSDCNAVLGDDDPLTLATRDSLAGAYKSAGRLDEAIAMFEQILPDCIRFLSDNHPQILTSRNNLAGAYLAAGRLTEAITLYEQVFTDRTRILSDNHPQTLISRNNLVGAYQAAGRLTEAIGQFEQLLADCLRVLEADHPLTAVVHENLEAARRELAKQEESSPTEEREQED